MKKALWLEIFLVLLIGAVPLFIVNGIFSDPAKEEPPPLLPRIHSQHETTLKLTAYSLFFLAPAVAMVRSGRSPAYFGIRWAGSSAVVAGFVCFLLNYATAWLVWWLYWATNFPLGHEDIAAFHYIHAESWGDAASMLPWYVIVVIGEEQFARCYLATRIREASGSDQAAIWLSALAYTAWHPHWGFAGMGHVFAGGLLFGWFFLRYGGVVAPAIAHFIFDALTLLPR